MLCGKWVMRAGKGQEYGFLSLLALLLMMKVLEKRVTREGKGYNKMDHMDKRLSWSICHKFP